MSNYAFILLLHSSPFGGYFFLKKWIKLLTIYAIYDTIELENGRGEENERAGY
jgi:hypothetical protein